MASFAGVTFQILRPNRPVLEKQLAYSVTHYPDSDTDEIQTAGTGNGRIKLPALIASLANLTTLRNAMAAATVGSLAGAPEGTLSNMLLVGIGGPRMTVDSRVIADLEFLQTT